jgi:hypothetical protein
VIPTARAARVGRARRSVRVPEPTGVYKPRQLALRVRGRDAVLTKFRTGWNATAERRRQRPAAERVGLPRRRMMPGWPGPLDGGKRSERFLRRE